LFAALAEKRTRALGGALDAQAISVPVELGDAIKAATRRWRDAGFVRRLWQRDKRVWTAHDEDRWLGWLDSVNLGLRSLHDYAAFADEVRREGFTDAVLLGMGGSSLGPEVLATTFGRRLGFPHLRVLDSTDPEQVRAAEDAITLDKTLFIV